MRTANILFPHLEKKSTASGVLSTGPLWAKESNERRGHKSDFKAYISWDCRGNACIISKRRSIWILIWITMATIGSALFDSQPVFSSFVRQTHVCLPSVLFVFFFSFQRSPHFKRRRKPYLEILWTKVGIYVPVCGFSTLFICLPVHVQLCVITVATWCLCLLQAFHLAFLWKHAYRTLC